MSNVNFLEEEWMRKGRLYRLFSRANRIAIEREQRHWPRREKDIARTNRIHERLMIIEEDQLQLMVCTGLFGDK